MGECLVEGEMREILVRHKSFLLRQVEPIIWGDFGVFRIILGLQLILHSFSQIFYVTNYVDCLLLSYEYTIFFFLPLIVSHIMWL